MWTSQVPLHIQCMLTFFCLFSHWSNYFPFVIIVLFSIFVKNIWFLHWRWENYIFCKLCKYHNHNFSLILFIFRQKLHQISFSMHLQESSVKFLMVSCSYMCTFILLYGGRYETLKHQHTCGFIHLGIFRSILMSKVKENFVK